MSSGVRYTDQELLALLRAANGELGGVMTVAEYDELARGRHMDDGRRWPTHRTVANRFGSWRDGLLAAGLAANPSSPIAGQHLFDAGHCVDAIRHVARRLGRRPSRSTYGAAARDSAGALPSIPTIVARCGSWSEALRRTGL